MVFWNGVIMLESLTKFDVYFVIVLNGLFTGIGVTLGVYLTNKHIIKRLKKIKNFIKRKIK